MAAVRDMSWLLSRRFVRLRPAASFNMHPPRLVSRSQGTNTTNTTSGHGNKLGENRAATLAGPVLRNTVQAPFMRFYSSTANNKQSAVLSEIQRAQSGHVFATLTISNPRKLNIVSTPLLHQLIEKCKYLSEDPTLRAVVVTGGETAPGKAPAFIGGADINEMHQLSSSDEARQFITNIHLACRAIRDIPVPVIARVDGYALGAGLEIMAACDLRVATEGSTFAMPEVKVGIPSVVEAALLPGLIGMGRTRRLLYLAENIKADQAKEWGLVDRVVSDISNLDSAVLKWVEMLCTAGPGGIREQKRLMQGWEDSSVTDGITAGIDSFANAYKDGGVEPKEYMSRFLKK